jgi:hypothetical protein
VLKRIHKPLHTMPCSVRDMLVTQQPDLLPNRRTRAQRSKLCAQNPATKTASQNHRELSGCRQSVFPCLLCTPLVLCCCCLLLTSS